ncbi:hypothetical protein A3L09_04265 [Thermococcus profundus]|uniref:KaiC-like domain-containing protein n=1 Tax=Thermococcus profundus TaxID=49899 RepID=A0A2Z2MAP6_THEPR|nr:DUF257 family protein [Thermococcus profundus]ASJ02523.1 hypothetical protein A3L09_04265 [Thermococcus profundus]
MEKAVGEFEGVLDGIKFGEIVMIEYSGYSTPVRSLYYLTSWAEKRHYKVVIVDILDTLYLHYQHMRLNGMNVEKFKDIDVIKIGGRTVVGNVIGQLNITGSTVGEKAFSRTYESAVKDGNVVMIVLGLEKLMMLFAESRRGILNIVNTMLSHVGDERVKGFCFINRTLMKEVSPYIIPLVAELTTTVIEIERASGTDVVRVAKALNPGIEMMEVKLA